MLPPPAPCAHPRPRHPPTHPPRHATLRCAGKQLADLPAATFWAVLHLADLFAYEALAAAMTKRMLLLIKSFADLRQALE